MQRIHPDLADVADLLGLRAKSAARFCAEVAWHVEDRQVTYRAIADAIDAHPRVDPTPRLVAEWIMATPADPAGGEADDYVEIEFDPRKGKPNRMQQHDFRDAQAGLPKCPHGIPITPRCRICRPRD
jgi:hypothetical protein